ncbi:MAG TPA: hypothetical protein DCZ73_08705 [Bacteroides sp.]|nr:hypothetical protein [Bacteroides sp.]
MPKSGRGVKTFCLSLTHLPFQADKTRQKMMQRLSCSMLMICMNKFGTRDGHKANPHQHRIALRTEQSDAQNTNYTQ